MEKVRNLNISFGAVGHVSVKLTPEEALKTRVAKELPEGINIVLQHPHFPSLKQKLKTVLDQNHLSVNWLVQNSKNNGLELPKPFNNMLDIYVFDGKELDSLVKYNKKKDWRLEFQSFKIGFQNAFRHSFEKGIGSGRLREKVNYDIQILLDCMGASQEVFDNFLKKLKGEKIELAKSFIKVRPR